VVANVRKLDGAGSRYDGFMLIGLYTKEHFASATDVPGWSKTKTTS